ncbi:conserved hypothetical protein [Leishmania major strain Friedlin]|uniref:Uncharacterized protein n=1 Tax=Leishmania major TaxID=5664 RepID=Q4Q1P1_LEIMA|nr:conserved hypothetical protein [Leishmania major strain Friedlin]CAG9583705.1 hypothetical_protein_-_conserved [Leishmania major strain Friedlin]CAJ09138.1 conserved hypothetical protein [Leishmania major strain Friedlin]|eukprot:XP_001686757.1 conserved hypothetical protein [Leishmania major strain Friedlin]
MQTEDAAQSPPRKKRGVAVAGPADRDKMTAAAVVSVPPLPSSFMHVPPSSHERHTERKPQPGSKRGRAGKRQSCVGGERPRGSHCHTETALDGIAAPASATFYRPTGTNRTLIYDVESPLLLCTPRRSLQDAAASPPPLVRSIATPARRNAVVLTSTPLVIREERERVAEDDAAAHDPSALLRTPLRLVRAARGLLSPATATLRRRLTHLRQSATGATGSERGLQRQQSTAARSASPPPPSPWGQLSTIVPATDSLPSCVEEEGGSGSASARAASRRRGLALSSEPLPDAAALSSIPASQRTSVSASDMWRRSGRGAELPELLRSTMQPGSVVLSHSSDDDITASLSRRSSPIVTAVDEARGGSRFQRRRRVDEDLRGAGMVGGTAALRGPYDVRFARVSSLSESLADIVSSSRSTAHSSLTSVAAAAASSAVAQDRISSAGHGSAGDAREACMPRRSATVMDPNFSSILPDEEELAIRRRLQRGRNRQTPHSRSDSDIRGAGVAALVQERQHPVGARVAAGNVMELFVSRAPQPAPLAWQQPLQPEVRRRTSSGCASGVSVSAAGGMAAAASVHQRVASRAHDADVWPPQPQRRSASSTLLSPPWLTVACVSRLTVALLSALVCVWCVVAVALPLVALQPRYTLSAVARADSVAAEVQFVQTHANSVTEMQALYKIVPASLSADAVVRLHHRTLSEGVERLERATQHLVPDDNAPPWRRLFYLRAMIRAYLALSRNCELYARSRDGSHWRRYVVYPLADMKRYGVRRFGSIASRSSITTSAAAAWRDRVWTTVVCSAQSEVLACPSVLYVEEAMARDAAQFVYTDVNEAHESPQRKRKLQDWRVRLHRDWTSEVYLETLLRYIRSGVQELTRNYNR